MIYPACRGRAGAFNQKFEDFVSEQPRTLAELVHRFDQIELIDYDFDTRSFSAPRITGLQKSVTGRSRAAVLIGDFVNSRTNLR